MNPLNNSVEKSTQAQTQPTTMQKAQKMGKVVASVALPVIVGLGLLALAGWGTSQAYHFALATDPSGIGDSAIKFGMLVGIPALSIAGSGAAGLGAMAYVNAQKGNEELKEMMNSHRKEI